MLKSDIRNKEYHSSIVIDSTLFVFGGYQSNVEILPNIQKSNQSFSKIDILPDEILLLILSYLHATNLCKVSCVSKSSRLAQLSNGITILFNFILLNLIIQFNR